MPPKTNVPKTKTKTKGGNRKSEETKENRLQDQRPSQTFKKVEKQLVRNTALPVELQGQVISLAHRAHDLNHVPKGPCHPSLPLKIVEQTTPATVQMDHCCSEPRLNSLWRLGRELADIEQCLEQDGVPKEVEVQVDEEVAKKAPLATKALNLNPNEALFEDLPELEVDEDEYIRKMCLEIKSRPAQSRPLNQLDNVGLEAFHTPYEGEESPILPNILDSKTDVEDNCLEDILQSRASELRDYDLSQDLERWKVL